MVKKCCVRSCPSESFGGCHISFHSFPKKEEMRQKWLTILKVTKNITKNSVVCSRHFEPSSFFSANSRLLLKANAVPMTLPVMKLKPPSIPSHVNNDKLIFHNNDIPSEELSTPSEEAIPGPSNDALTTREKELMVRNEHLQQKILEQNQDVRNLKTQNKKIIDRVLKLEKVVKTLLSKVVMENDQDDLEEILKKIDL